MGEFSLPHLLILLLILLIFFGPSRLPQLGSSLGKAIRGFKEGLNEMNAAPPEADKAPPQQAAAETKPEITVVAAERKKETQE